MRMHYDYDTDAYGNPHAGYGYIYGSDIPSSATSAAKVAKQILGNNGKIYFECASHKSSHNDNDACKYAYPLIKHSEKDQINSVYVEFTISNISISSDGSTKSVKITAKAADNEDMKCPEWTTYNNSSLPVSWKVTHTKNDAGTENYYKLYIDGTYTDTYTLSQAALNHVSPEQLKDAIIENMIIPELKNIINDLLSDPPLNGIRPSTRTDAELTSDIGNISITIANGGSGTIYIPVKQVLNDGRQVFVSAGLKAKQPYDTYLKITKKVTDGYDSLLSNPLYDLSEVFFDVYYNSSCTGECKTLRLTDITTNKTSGTLTFAGNKAGTTVYIKERISNSKVIGYNYKDTVWDVTLGAAGSTVTVDIENTPINDPVSIQIQKDSNLNGGNWIGTYDRSGIEYTLEYYTSKSAASSGSSPYRTWKFETNSSGRIDCASSSYLKSGTLFMSGSRVIYPVGWYRFYESTSESELNRRGLELNKKKYYLTVTDDGSGRDKGKTTVYTDSNFSVLASNTWGNAAQGPKIYEKSANTYGTIEDEHWKTFSFTKKDAFLNGTGPTGDATFAGIQFKLYCESDVFNGSTTYGGHTYSINNNKEVVIDGSKSVILTADASGKVTCNYKLPKEDTTGRRFYVVETSVPSSCGYKTPNATKYYINWNNANPTITNTTVKNTPRMGKIIIHKRDDDSKNHMAQGDASLAGIKFAIVNRSTHSVHVDGDAHDIAKGAVVKIVTTNENGEASAEKLPYGTYDIYELSEDSTLTVGSTYTAAAAGSSIYANKSYLVSNNKLIGRAVIHPTNDSNTSVTKEFTVENSVVRADLRVKKVDTEMTDVQGDASLAGIQYAIVNSSKSKKSVTVNDTTYNVGDVIYLIETIVIMHKFANAFLLNCLNFI